MNAMKRLYYFLSAFTMMGIACRQSYQPPAIASGNNYLVVDGFLHAGADSTIVTLTRTRSLTSTYNPVPEPGAQVTVESDGGFTGQLSYLGSGRYGAVNIIPDNTGKYRLSIVTSNGSKYLSDYTTVKISPPIDSITWQQGDSGVAVYANTHDPSNNSKYYRWEYTETWEYHSSFESHFHYNPLDTSVNSTSVEIPHICWDTDNSTDILISSSATLSQDIISRAPLTIIPPASEKLTVKYSILAKQYALTPEAYNYWETLQKSTEQSGGIFDQEPSQITGNIHCLTNANEPVIGYIGAGSTTEKRIFITNDQVTPWVYDPHCGLIAIHSKDSLAIYESSGGWLIVETLPVGNFNISAYILSSNYCVDCTVRRGTDIKPSFW
jgi:hypothetical protein